MRRQHRFWPATASSIFQSGYTGVQSLIEALAVGDEILLATIAKRKDYASWYRFRYHLATETTLPGCAHAVLRTVFLYHITLKVLMRA